MNEEEIYEAYNERRPIMVYAKCAGQWINEADTEFRGIEEDIEGKDVLTFKCPMCGEEHKSRRHG